MEHQGGIGARQKLLLVFLAGDVPLDPIRIMKGIFLFSQECPSGWIDDADRYVFEPYDWGPFSRDVYRDLDALSAEGLIRVTAASGRDWNYHAATDAGLALAAEVRQQYKPALAVYLSKLRNYVLSVNFSTLLKTVYQKYPNFAVNSVFHG